MALALEWVDIIHTKLMLVYGTKFSNQYAGLQPDHVKADWAHELSGMSVEGIKHALETLPRDWPPNVLQFRDLCRYRPLPATDPALTLKGRKPTASEAQRLKAALARLGTFDDPLRWARRLQAMEARGESLSSVQRKAWRQALDHEATALNTEGPRGEAHDVT
jgi:hypothetical protein